MAGFLAEESQSAVDVVSDFIRDYGEPFRCLSPYLVFVVLKPLFNMHEVGKERALISWVNHPNDE